MATVRDSNKIINLSHKKITKINLKSDVHKELEYWANFIKKQGYVLI